MNIDIDSEFIRLRVQLLNDETRQCLPDGVMMLTPGILALAADDQSAILARVRSFDEFTEDNDPWGEHDFGSFEHNGRTIFWKVDCYDRNLEWGSPEPWNLEKTRRVLTVMLASEY